MAYTHILIPTDFSPLGNHAVHNAIEEAKLHQATLTLLHVLHHHPDTEERYITGDPETYAGLRGSMFAFPTRFDPDTGGRLPLPPMPHAQILHHDYLEEARSQLRDLVPKTFPGVWDVEVMAGDPAEMILQVAQKHATDLIVMGTHGRRGLPHLFLGSVAEKVLHHAPCPVLIIRHSTEKK